MSEISLAGRPDLQNIQNGQVIYADSAGDEALHVRFYRSPIDDLDHVEIMIPGDERLAPDFIVNESHKQRFPRQWAAYAGDGDAFAGQTRIETVNWIDPANINELKMRQIHTVEMLAAMTDDAVAASGMLGIHNFRQKAVKFVEDKQKVSRVDELEKQLAELRAQVQSQQAQPVRGRGRPRGT